MNDSTAMAESADDLEVLFDSIVNENKPKPAPVAEPSPLPEAAAATRQEPSAERVLSQVGQLTRTLYESLNALGYDKIIEKTAAAIPDARDRLAYVIAMTEQAADRTLNATDIVGPIQDGLNQGATTLSEQWDRLFARELSIEQFKQLVADTRSYLGDVPKQTKDTKAQMMEIMMAQDFQDLTGQVIKKTTDIIKMVEQELLRLLVENMPQERLPEGSSGLLNGPVVDATGRNDVVTSQVQVDDLLESLGF